MTLRLILVTSIISCLTACGEQTVHSSSEAAAAALNLISEDGIRAHVEYLTDDAREGRRSGEPGYDDAAAYVAEQFMAMGLSAGGTNDWYQPVSLRRYKIDTESAVLIVHRDGEDLSLTYRDEFAISGDAVKPETSVRAEVVYVGYGVHAPEFGYSDYDGIDVDGKIVAFFDGAPKIIEGDAGSYYRSSRIKTGEAVSRGAIGKIMLKTKESEERRPWDESKKRFGKRASTTWVNSAGEAARYFPEIHATGWLSLASAERLFSVTPLSFEEAHEAALQSVPSSIALGAEVSMSVNTTHSTVSSPNVIGLVRGTDPELRNEYVIYTAHLDHNGISEVEEDDGDKIRNGMYDNAMGVALMLETARAIAAAPPKRSVLFVALTAEESGLLGSDYFVNDPTVAIDSLVANINLDMPLFLYPLADLVAFGSQHSSLQSVAEAAAQEEGFVLSPDPIPEENLFIRSDQYSFVRSGIPAVYLVSGFNSTDEDIDGEALFRDHLENHYHQPSDDMSRPVDWGSALRFARAHTRMGYVVANDAERPTWNEGDFFGERFAKQK